MGDESFEGKVSDIRYSFDIEEVFTEDDIVKYVVNNLGMLKNTNRDDIIEALKRYINGMEDIFDECEILDFVKKYYSPEDVFNEEDLQEWIGEDTYGDVDLD